MSAAQEGGTMVPQRRGWWAKLAYYAAVMDDSPTEYLLDRVHHLERGMAEMRAELDALRARGVEP